MGTKGTCRWVFIAGALQNAPTKGSKHHPVPNFHIAFIGLQSETCAWPKSKVLPYEIQKKNNLPLLHLIRRFTWNTTSKKTNRFREETRTCGKDLGQTFSWHRLIRIFAKLWADVLQLRAWLLANPVQAALAKHIFFWHCQMPPLQLSAEVRAAVEQTRRWGSTSHAASPGRRRLPDHQVHLAPKLVVNNFTFHTASWRPEVIPHRALPRGILLVWTIFVATHYGTTRFMYFLFFFTLEPHYLRVI